MLIAILLFVTVLSLAFANGANDNFKGVATLFGSRTTDYRGALAWATICTVLGSLTSVLLAGRLLKAFSGKGLVGAELVSEPRYVAAVGIGAMMTVLLATRIGMPISTTHSLVGALAGAGWAAGSTVQLAQLSSGFFAPLLISPLVAVAGATIGYPALRLLRRRLGIGEATCLCVGNEVLEVIPSANHAMALRRMEALTATVADTVTCEKRYQGRVFALPANLVLDRAHYLSAGALCFARGLNDTPKIAALLLVTPAVGGLAGVSLVGAAMAIGGVLMARRVAETVSEKITAMNHGQGFTANMDAAMIVIGASRLGMPVSTTHVSCGALIGLGMVTGKAHPRMILTILLAWITTLPCGAAIGALVYLLLRQAG